MNIYAVFFRRLRRQLADGKNLRKYLAYAIGEIILIVLGILIALQVNTSNQNAIKRSNEITIYETTKDQLKNYRAIIQGDIMFNDRYMSQYEYANTIVDTDDRTKTDTLGKIAINLINYSDFDGQGNIYETLVNSGEIKLLKNLAIVEGLRHLEERFLRINRIENIHYDAMMTYVTPLVSRNINISTGEVQQVDKLYGVEFQNLVLLMLRIMYEKDEVYQASIREIDHLIQLIDGELEHN